ncbi:MAG: hypothetical protein ABEJ86_03230 [Halococcoides sp.]
MAEGSDRPEDSDDTADSDPDRDPEHRDDPSVDGWAVESTGVDPESAGAPDDEGVPFDRLPTAPAGASEDLLEKVDDVPPDDVWSAIDPIEEPRVLDQTGERDVRAVPIESYCRDCPHVADPPEFACTYDGCDILAVPSMGIARVADCPIVAERERLAEEW